MSSPIWTADALSSEFRPWQGEAWRLVEAQHRVSTMSLVDTLEEQRLLEELVERTKPSVPHPCRHLHWLLYTPFRYRPSPRASRFRRTGDPRGVFYAAECEHTALAEIVFWRLLFFAESPQTPWPDRPLEFTAFCCELATERALDLTEPPFDRHAALWTDPVDYTACHALAEVARDAGTELLRYASARDLESGVNLAVLACGAFAAHEPRRDSFRTWKLFFAASGVRALRAHPADGVEFGHEAFARDPRIAALRWAR